MSKVHKSEIIYLNEDQTDWFRIYKSSDGIVVSRDSTVGSAPQDFEWLEIPVHALEAFLVVLEGFKSK